MEPGMVVSDIIKEADTNLYLAPANVELISAEYRLLKTPDRTLRLQQAIWQDADQLDYILIDTPPSLSLLTVNGLVAAKELLIPVATNYLSMRGVRSLLESVWLIREKINPNLKLLGVLPTLVDANQSHAMSAIAEMQSVFKQKVFRTFIPLDEAAAIAPALRKNVIDYKPNSAAAIAYKNLAKEVSNAKR
jgi:chromosome partitioning protein